MPPQSRIKELPQEVVSRIAAGEVVEDPASVLRELIENSIDAGAKAIKIAVEDGGKKLIRVEDNGCGMTQEDIELAVRRFTTSKIQNVEDLEAIATLGFRGEALYAIASVSRTTIRSSTDESGEGWEGYFEEAKLLELKPAPHPRGTTVIVRDLFYNFPVRRKFLGSVYQETRKIIEVVTDYALSHPDISFTLIANGKEIIDARSTDSYLKRIESIYGEDFLKDLIEINAEYPDKLLIRGVASKPDRLRGTAVTQLFFVNGRRVRENKLRAAIYDAYEQEKLHPQFVLYIKVNPHYVDFNIHPQKKEVKFHKSLRIYEKLYRATREALKREEISYSPAEGKPVMKVIEAPPSFGKEPEGRQLELGEMTAPKPAAEKVEEAYVPEKIWQIHDSYIIAQVKGGIIIVDQHAAHERIIYEKLKNRKFKTQTFLFPIVLHLTPKEFSIYEELSVFLESYGFSTRKLSHRTVVVEGAPDVFKNLSKELFVEILHHMEGIRKLPDKHLELLKTIACKAAIKAGDPLTTEEMNALLDQLFSCENPYFCPHGRPTVIRISLEELERKFARNL